MKTVTADHNTNPNMINNTVCSAKCAQAHVHVCVGLQVDELVLIQNQ